MRRRQVLSSSSRSASHHRFASKHINALRLGHSRREEARPAVPLALHHEVKVRPREDVLLEVVEEPVRLGLVEAVLGERLVGDAAVLELGAAGGVS